jgi:ADP-ribose pyrophosphatase YjhB (NUDIX family)
MAQAALRRLKIQSLIWLGRMPTWVRLFLVRRVAPSFTVGTVCRIENFDGSVLLVSQPYRRGWGLPGGLLRRNEDAAAGVTREVREELGVDLVITGDPAVVIDPRYRRVDVIFPGRIAGAAPPDPQSAEVLEARWFAPDALPHLQAETRRALDVLGRRARGNA